MRTVPSTAVFCSSVMCFPGTLIRYFLNDSDTVPVAPIITGNIFKFHIHCVSTVRNSYVKIFSVSFLITFLWIMMFGLLLRMVLSVLDC